MVNYIRRLTPTEFVTNIYYLQEMDWIVILNIKKVIFSVNETYGEAKNLVGTISMLNIFSREQSDLDKRFELDEQISIRRSFNQMVEEFKNNREINNSKTLLKKS